MKDTEGSAQAGQYEIARDIRERIVEGELAPGSRIAGHRELVRRYDSSGVTVQRAMDLLIEQEFVQSVPRSGRFVAEHPPHLYRVGLVFPGHPERIHTYRWTRYFVALWAAAQRVSAEGPWEIVPYFDIEPTREGELTDGYRALMQEVESDRLAGLLFSYAPQGLAQTPLLIERPVPLVCLTPVGEEWGMSVGVDRDRVMERAVSCMVEGNRRRLAWVTITKQNPDWLRPKLQELNRRHGFYSPSAWVHPMHPYHPGWIHHTLKSMFSGPVDERPDGLVILDDHLVEPVAAALADLEIAVPEELLVVAYWNYPLACSAEVPVRRLGLDTGEELHEALRLLRKWQQGETDEVQARLEPIFAAQFRDRYGEGAEVPYREASSERDKVAVEHS